MPRQYTLCMRKAHLLPLRVALRRSSLTVLQHIIGTMKVLPSLSYTNGTMIRLEVSVVRPLSTCAL